MKKGMVIYISIIVIMLLAILGLLIYKNTFKLIPFKILEFKQDFKDLENLNTLTFEKNKKASNYTIDIYSKNEKIKTLNTKEPMIRLNDLNIDYDQELTIKVYAENKKSRIESDNELKIKWKLPSIAVEDNNVINDRDLSVSVLFDTNNVNNDYFLNLKQNNKILKAIEIKDNKVTISKDILKDVLGDCTLQLSVKQSNKEYILYENNIKIVLPQITDIEFVNPKKNEEIKWDDFELTFKGGSNATNYNINILENDTSIINENITERLLKIDITKLKENTNYKLVITASNNKDISLTKKFETTFKTKKKEKVSSVTSSKASGNIYIGSQIFLNTTTKNSTIYYTTDGSTPTKDSIKYNGNITINKNTTIKAVAVCKNYFDSDISTFTYTALVKPISIYLSPSNQTWNLGVQSVGYTNESLIMNKLADIVEPILKSKGFTVYRNKPSMSLDEIVDQSKSLNVDLHLALHSNASANPGTMTGIETYVYTKTSPIAPLARNLQASMNSIYYKTNPRGIIYGLESDYILREINPKRVDNGILIEVAYHDHETDAKWILDNLSKIGSTIAGTVSSYFGK